MTARVLYLFVCGAGPASRIRTLIDLAHQQNWSVYCVATPTAAEHFLDISEVQAVTGHSVRTTYRQLEDEPLPRADAVVVAPATYNTINKWAAGIADTYVLSQLAELTGLGVRIVAQPFVNQALAANDVFVSNLAALRKRGVRVIFGPGEFEPHPPRSGALTLDSYPWELCLRAANEGHR